jgi:hypothetical protein
LIYKTRVKVCRDIQKIDGLIRHSVCLPFLKTLLDDQKIEQTKRLNRLEEVEQYFPVYGFYRYTEQEIQRSKDRMRRRRKIYSTLAARRKTTSE